jgi:hypothetical protein
MSAPDSRIARFVQAARSLLVLQLLLGLLAALVAVWAFVEVRGLVAQRDQLRNRLGELENQVNMQNAVAPAPLPLPPPGPAYDYNVAIPPPVNMIVPETVEPPANIQLPEPANVSDSEDSFANQVGPPRRPERRPLERPPVEPQQDRLSPRGDPLGQPPG